MVSSMDIVTARPTELDRYAALARTTGIIGIAFLLFLFGPIIALASADEPMWRSSSLPPVEKAVPDEEVPTDVGASCLDWHAGCIGGWSH